MICKAKTLTGQEKWEKGYPLSNKDRKRMFLAMVSYLEDDCPVIGYTEVDPATICRATGLKDKNGKEIYDGDIMNFKADKSSPSGGRYCGTVGFHPENAKVVEWDEGRFILGSRDLLTELKMYEVIGNKHSNPELRETKP